MTIVVYYDYDLETGVPQGGSDLSPMDWDLSTLSSNFDGIEQYGELFIVKRENLPSLMKEMEVLMQKKHQDSIFVGWFYSCLSKAMISNFSVTIEWEF
jgi:hypothetical protein